MATNKPTPEREKLVLETRIFHYYQTGASIKYVANELSVSYSIVNDLFFEWDRSKENAKKTIEEFESPFQIDFERPKNSDFVLMTNNQQVLDAYFRLVNPEVKLRKTA